MTWKRKGFWICIALIANLVGYYLINRIYRAFNPNCFDNIESSAKSSDLIMQKIGGYDSKYSEVELENYKEGRPEEFELRILGHSSIVTFTGSLRNDGNQCRILKIDTTFSEYEK